MLNITAVSNFVSSYHHFFSLKAQGTSSFRRSALQKMVEKVIWIDTDCGFDDLCAISLLADYGLRFPKKLEIGYVSSVNGMTNPLMGQSVIKKLLQFSAFNCRPMVACGIDSEASQMNFITESDWGTQYINDFSAFASKQLQITNQTDSELHQSVGDNGVQNNSNIDEMISEITKLEKAQKVTLLCLGPLTNIANIIRRNPTFLEDRVEKIVLMGGAVLVSGNAPGNAEYNFYMDPVSAAFVLQNCKIPIEMLGLEVANDKYPTKEQYVQLTSAIRSTDQTKDNTNEIFQPKTFIRDLAIQRKDSLSYDPIVSYYLMNPDAFTFETMKIKVDSLTGHTRRVEMDGMKDHSMQDVVEVSLAVSFRNEEYFNYLESIFAG